MIREGRKAVDTAGIAALHGLSERQGLRARPWAKPDHPERITTGSPRRGQPDLWDRAQADAYARGEPIPSLPEQDAPNDLLDRNECAILLGIEPKTWTDYKVPGGVNVCGREHWPRHLVEAFQQERAERAELPHGGRPPGRKDTKTSAEIRREIGALIDAGETNTAEIARRVGVAYSTAANHVKAITQAQK